MRKGKTLSNWAMFFKFGIYSIVILLVIFANSSTEARSLFNDQFQNPGKATYTAEDPYVTIGVHNVGRIGLTITNQGQIGTGFMGSMVDPLDPATVAPSCTYPYPGNQSYLWAGALWIGAIVGNDTLVSVGADGWINTEEMWPDSYPRGDIKHLSSLYPDDVQAVSEQDFISIYTDTNTNPAYVFNDPVDGRSHIPLNVEITQKTHVWSDPALDDFVIFEYFIKNIGTETLEDAYLGIYVDGDVGQVDGGIGEAIDDICGFKKTIESPFGCDEEETINLAWIADNNGRNETAECPYDANAVTSVTGISLLYSPSNSLTTNFNWWISNANAALDFGPRKAGTEEDPFRDFGGYLGTPMGDRNKYYIMSHPEVDYDQLFCAKDNSADGWLEKAPEAADFADGYDTRYLLSFGPFNIQPGEELPLVFAYVAGENFHTDCNAYETIFDNSAPEAYYNTFNFDDIGQNALNARWRYDTPGVDTDGDGYKGKYRMCGEDTVYYKGDGVSELLAVNTCPPSLRTTPGETLIKVKWNGLKSEYYDLVDFRKFDGYKIYLASGDNVEENDFELIATYDLEDYYIYYGTGEPDEWLKVSQYRKTPDIIQQIYGIDNPEDYDINNPLLYEGTYYYFEPIGENNATDNDPAGIHKLYSESPYPSTENPRYGTPEDLTDDEFLKYFEYEYVIQNLDPGVKYHIDVIALYYGGIINEIPLSDNPETVVTNQPTDIGDPENGTLPGSFSLDQNWPNPFNPSTSIKFTLPRASNIKLEIFNILGQRVIELGNGFYEAGTYSEFWDGTDSNGKNVSTGVYFYQLSAGDYNETRKMLLLK